MKLVRLDANNTVVECFQHLPLRVRLDDTYAVAQPAVQVGWVLGPDNVFAPPPNKRWITRRSFRNRFTQTETQKIELLLADLSRTDATDDQRKIAAQISAFQREVSDGPYVDMDLPETVSGINWMWYVAGVMDSELRVTEFLDGPIAESEYAPEARE